eukprot:6178550-Pleurochrysis_carterae.AAC.7
MAVRDAAASRRSALPRALLRSAQIATRRCLVPTYKRALMAKRELCVGRALSAYCKRRGRGRRGSCAP